MMAAVYTLHTPGEPQRVGTPTETSLAGQTVGVPTCAGFQPTLTPALSRREREPVPSSTRGSASRPNWLPLL